MDEGNNDQPLQKVRSYEELLQDQRWIDKRDIAVKQHGGLCEWCGSTQNLQLHHKYYNKFPDERKADPWDYPDKAFMVLCKDCHKKYHDKYKVKWYYRKFGEHY